MFTTAAASTLDFPCYAATPREYHHRRLPSPTMESCLIRRPAVNILAGRHQCLLQFSTSSRRHEQSYRRTQHRLNIRPDSSFLQSQDAPKQAHIIFNPPSSAPSVFHTPLKFLPKEDKRRAAQVALEAKINPTPKYLPPPVFKKPSVPVHHLTDADILEIQRLRREEGVEKWTTHRLAKKFNCSKLFVMICLRQCGGEPPDPNYKNAEQLKMEAIEKRWGPRRRMAHEDRLKRMQMALRGD
ncbi:hypothetical protein HYFRA_00001117 [Hymenoscyphus fraxineus]|uniref:60S ribosomal protein L20 n=1 Tax=Hymenoscyphus fraxineus TaxID=746836 RepID=A0A9N9PMH8_9HELO|nr:hypothetical protein HYFRA_00001117 [Hymenoscyphus fraxineus]